MRKSSHSMWERAGERAGDGAGKLFASLDAQDAQEARDPLSASAAHQRAAAAVNEAHVHGAEALERVAEQIRAGAWSADIAALVAEAIALLDAER